MLESFSFIGCVFKTTTTNRNNWATQCFREIFAVQGDTGAGSKCYEKLVHCFILFMYLSAFCRRALRIRAYITLSHTLTKTDVFLPLQNKQDHQ